MQTSPAEIDKILQRLEETPRRLALVMSQRQTVLLHDKVEQEEWSMDEILAHLRVCAEVWGKSILTMLAQDQPTLRYVSPRTVAKKRNYATQPYQESFQAFAKQRHDLLQALQALNQDGWSRGATFTGTTRGREQTVYSYAQRIADHESEHLAQIDNLLKTMLVQ